MKKRFLLIAIALIALLASCPDPNTGNTEDTQLTGTIIVFDNTRGVCSVTVYDDIRRRNQDKIAEIPAGQLSKEMKWSPGTSVPFFLSFTIKLDSISINYVPEEVGRNQMNVSIDRDKKTTIAIPRLDETVSSADTLLTTNCYLSIQNNAGYPFQLYRGSSSVNPDNSSFAVVNSGERAGYTVTTGAASAYRLLVAGDYLPLSSPVTLEGGHAYRLILNPGNTISLSQTIKLTASGAAGLLGTSKAMAIPLSVNTWVEGSITSSTAGRAVWYSFSATSSTTYYIWWEDRGSPSSSTKSLDAKVSAQYSNGSSIFADADSGWSSPWSFTASTSGTVIIMVEPKTSGGTGTFAIAYTTSYSRP
jgi:hypothetical protein